MNPQATPRVDRQVAQFTRPEDAMITPNFARKLERELRAAKREIARLTAALNQIRPMAQIGIQAFNR